MKKKLIITFVIILLLSSAFAYVASTDFSFSKFGNEIKSMLANDNTKGNIVVLVNNEPIYIENIMESSVFFSVMKNNNIEYLSGLAENKEVTYTGSLTDIIKDMEDISINPSLVLDEKINEVLILQDALSKHIVVDEDLIREQIIVHTSELEQNTTDDNDASSSLYFLNDYYDSIHLTEKEILDRQVQFMVSEQLRRKHKIYIIEEHYGKDTFKSYDIDQDDFYDSYCNQLKTEATIEHLLNISEMNFLE